MLPAATVTLDVEDLRPRTDTQNRVVDATNRVLDLFAELRVRASIFVVGELAERHPKLVQRAASEGHEVGLHAWTHVPLPKLTIDEFTELNRRGRALLQDLSGQEVSGFRAPMMSLVPEAAWTVPLLTELGFSYSSSVLPAPSPLYGWPGLPRTPFKWLNGPTEFPCPLVRLGPFDLPYLGGTYLRVLPTWVRKYGLRRADSGEALWSYCHPWEFDLDEPFHRHEHIGALASRLAWVRRSRMDRQVRYLLADPLAPPLGEVAPLLEKDQDQLEVIDPQDAMTSGRTSRWSAGWLRESRR